MEITAHGGARPEHASWQGKIVCIEDKRKGYLSLKDIGYGTATGFKGVNCRHDWFPFIEGISTRAYTEKQLRSYRDRTVTYYDEEISQYEAEQKQRKMERDMRSARCKAAGYDEAAKAAEDNKLKENLQTDFYNAAQKLKRQEKAYADFCKQTGLSAQIRSRAIVRNVSADDMKNALTNPLDTGKIRTDMTQQFIGEKATVAVNVETGVLTTVWPTSASRVKKLKERNIK